MAKSNVDIQLIVSRAAIADYLGKYITKPETDSSLHDVISSFITSSNPQVTNPVFSAFRRAIVNQYSSRTVSSQEAMVLLLNYPLHCSSANVQFINLKDSSQFTTKVATVIIYSISTINVDDSLISHQNLTTNNSPIQNDSDQGINFDGCFLDFSNDNTLKNEPTDINFPNEIPNRIHTYDDNFLFLRDIKMLYACRPNYMHPITFKTFVVSYYVNKNGRCLKRPLTQKKIFFTLHFIVLFQIKIHNHFMNLLNTRIFGIPLIMVLISTFGQLRLSSFHGYLLLDQKLPIYLQVYYINV